MHINYHRGLLGGWNFALKLYNGKTSVLFFFFYIFLVYVTEFISNAWKFPTKEKFLKFLYCREISLRLATLHMRYKNTYWFIFENSGGKLIFKKYKLGSPEVDLNSTYKHLREVGDIKKDWEMYRNTWSQI